MKLFLAIFKLILTVIYHYIEACVVKIFPWLIRPKDVRGEIVLITGAGGGIGRYLALDFAQLGCRIVCWDVSTKANEETAKLVKSKGGEAFTYNVDLRNRKEVYRTAELVKQDVGKVTILINNAGILIPNLILETSDEEIQQTMEVNTLAHFWTIKAFLGDMMALKKGHIVTLSSMCGLFGTDSTIDYCASKFGSYGLTEALRMELELNGHGAIKTTLVCPYFVKTPLTYGVLHSPVLDLIPWLEPKEVSRRIVHGVLRDDYDLVFPWIIQFLTLVKPILPYKAGLAIYQFLCGKQGARNLRKEKLKAY